MKIQKYHAVLWDLDGTLLNTLDDLADAVNTALMKFGLPPRTGEEVRRDVGNGAARLLELSVPGGKDYPEFDAILKYFKSYYTENCNNKTKPYPGVEEALRALKSLGFKMAIVSNKPDPAVKTLKKLHFADSVSAAIGEREGIRRKPSPDATFEAMRLLGAGKEETVYVGDSEVDIATAINAGIDCISVSWGFRSADALRAAGAMSIAATPEELLFLLRP